MPRRGTGGTCANGCEVPGTCPSRPGSTPTIGGCCPTRWSASVLSRSPTPGPVSSSTCSAADPVPRWPPNWASAPAPCARTPRPCCRACAGSAPSTRRASAMAEACPDDEDLLALTVEGPTTSLREHLRGCADCLRRLGRLEAEVADLRRALGEDVRVLATRQARGAARPAELPVAIGRYRVLGLLAVEGEAEVYRVAHPTLETELVLKLSRWGAGG